MCVCVCVCVCVLKAFTLALGKNSEAIRAQAGTVIGAVSSWKIEFGNFTKNTVGALNIPMKAFCELLVPRGLLSDEVIMMCVMALRRICRTVLFQLLARVL